jgi:hypothetical protein
MGQDFQIIQIEIAEEELRKLPNRQRNQLVGCMHAHNEVAILNRLLLFSMNDTGEGDLHNAAQSIQMWCLLQILVGKLFETWNMLIERFLKANPEDPAVVGLEADHKASLGWLKEYFGVDHPLKENALRTVRDKTAFHYDKLNLTEAVANLAEHENILYLAQHPANSLYYVGSSVVFRTVFAMIADEATDTAGLTHDERTNRGFGITRDEVQVADLHMHKVLYGLVRNLLDNAFGKPLDAREQTRINVIGAPTPEKVGLPAFVDIGPHS